MVRPRAGKGAMLALRLRPGQMRTLAKGLAGSWRRWTRAGGNDNPAGVEIRSRPGVEWKGLERGGQRKERPFDDDE